MIDPELLRSYTEKARRGERPTEEEAIAFLCDWHARHPGGTAQAMAPYRLTSGESTYQRLAACVPAGADNAVLDLCCGDGALIEFVASRLGPGGSVVGVDVSEEDLEVARRRVADPRARFQAGRAGALPLPDASIDIVLCHYALMLIRPLEPAVAEIARVLRPGGLFAAVLPSGWNIDAAAPDFAALMGQVRARELPAFPDIGLGEPRLGTGGPGAFFNAESGFAAPLSSETLTMEKRIAPAELIAYMTLTYPFDLYREEGQRRIREEGLAVLERAADADGRLLFRQEIRLVTIRRA